MAKRSARLALLAATLSLPLASLVSVAEASSADVTVTVGSTNPISLMSTIYDFENTANDCSSGPINTDFETYSGGGPTTGLVQSTLDSDHLPLFASDGVGTRWGRQITSPTTFGQWYHPTDDVNIAVDASLDMTDTPDEQSPTGHRYTYGSATYFPADGLGWNDPKGCATPQLVNGIDNKPHNFSFTQHLWATFVYQPGETLYAGGDDDVWVFIDGRLFTDLGGLHTFADGGTQLLDDFGLIEGHTYRFDLFFAERHSTGSTLQLDTTMALQSPLAVSNLSIAATSVPSPLGPGASDVAIGDIPASSLPAIASGAVAAAPLRSVPLRSVPLRSVPLRSVPLRSVPLRSVPLQAVLLSQVPLTGTTWSAVLAGTPYANAPLQSVTLQQAYDAISASGYNGPGVRMDQIDLSQTPLGAMSVVSLFLGDSPISSIPIGSPPDGYSSNGSNTGDWCGWIASLGYDCGALGIVGSSPVLSADLQGVPLRSVPLRSVPLRSVPADAPLRSVPLRSVDIADSPLRSVPLTSLIGTVATPSKFGALLVSSLSSSATVFSRPLSESDSPAIVTCSPPSAPCDTLGHAPLAGELTVGTLARSLADVQNTPLTLGELGDLPDDFTIGDLAANLTGDTPTLGDVMLALMPAAAVPWESIPLAQLPLAEHQPGSPSVRYRVSVDLAGITGQATGSFVVTLPSGFRYAGDPQGLITGDHVSSTDDLVTFTLGDRPVPSTVTVSFLAHPGLALGPYPPASAKADFTAFALPHSTETAVESAAGLTVTDGAEATNNSPATAPLIVPDHLVLGAVGSAGDVDYYRLAAPTAGTHVHVLLSHLPTDDDLVVYGPPDSVGSPNAAPLRSVPLRSVPLLDNGVDPSGATSPTPQMLNDVPLRSDRPVLGESAHHGTSDEEVDLLSTGGSAPITIQVSGYNGVTSNDPYVLRVVEDTPVTTTCSSLGLAGQTQLTGGLPAGNSSVKSLFLIDTQQMASEYGSSAESDLVSSLQALAARHDVAGLVVPVDADATVVSAYNAWNADPCSTTAADSVVEAVNAVVRGYRAGSAPNITSVTLIGSDRQLPMYRVPDLTLSANENGYAANDAPVTGGNDPLSAAQRASNALTDDAYGSLTPVSWLGRRLYLPDLAVGRLVETPAEIKVQLQQFVDAGGALTPTTGLTTGYDFLADGAEAVDSALSTELTGARTTLIDDPGASSPWTRAQLAAALFPSSGQSPELASINAHFDHNRALPSAGNATGSETDLFTVNDVAANRIPGRVLFSMGCHAGLNVPDGYVGGPTTSTGGTPALAQDWPQTLAGQKAIWVANTGFGLGDTDTVALSEQLMKEFAQRLNGSMTAGQALQYAKQAYFGQLGAYGVYDEKAMEEPVFYGLPMWRVGGPAYDGTTGTPPGPLSPSTAPADPAAAHASTSAVTDSYSHLAATDIGIAPSLNATTTGNGTFWNVGGETQVTHYRPIEPRTSVGVSPPAGQQAHGALITGLVSQDVLNVDPVFARPTVDLSANEPEASASNVTFPTQFQTLTTFTQPTGSATRLVLLPGQFFSNPNSAKGTQRLFTSMHSRVLFSGSANYVAPTINTATTTNSSGGVTFTVDATPHGGATITRVLVLFHNAGFSTWSSLDLAASGGVFSGQTPDADGSLEWFAQVEDSDGNVAVTDDKGELFGSQSAFHASVTGPAGANGWFTGAVTINANGPASDYTVWLGNASTAEITTSPYVLQNDGQYVVSVHGTENGVAVVHKLGTVKIDSLLPTAHFQATPATFSLDSSGTFPIVCDDPGGVGVASGVADADCPQGGVSTSVAGGHTLTVTVRDRAGNVATVPLSYTVNATLYGFLQPINDSAAGGGAKSVFKYGSTIPVKFQLKDGNGVLVSDAAASSIANACQAVLSYQSAGSNSTTTDESVYSSAADAGNCFRYDASADQFVYNLSSKLFTGTSNNWTLTALIMVAGGEVAKHSVTIATK